ncbi:MAG TPA: UDP-glucose/GDP-mannose dehydrogenase family protein [Candidatus Cloacimonadota bacterium]|jgi:UDPglucose 6-dehydrogenase|nr:UDP-glucose/GDP-mannose dehydrogenase family protein [Candidatus Cloacimonadota bacterium]HOF59588.1 UDP-glucose/GDP-mannose dehydrogenase family protein [Candidatus Cloacimonadota bacterium]HOR58698.1 UDP-glucose/GDP-mannose dehydrogenase family protein [Candidatus Cloacimonadota bacterium]HPB08148.1 UDP-glucose/GDP-mannose dehydrogenase family protein [Candidatus Cloacimonadota bacterium]HQL13322.1 UDP-glucose/GDP-mannose dehydrogenase family protein [Candidatus Cloacimonadota bacterium]
MNLAMIGSGYVGLVSGTCFANMGNHVICVDNNHEKIKRLNNNDIPIYEPGLKELVKVNRAAGRLSFTTDLKHAVQECPVIFIAVGTPPGEDGSADLSYVLQVAEDIATHMQEHKIIVNKSTVPVGTADMVKEKIAGILDAMGKNLSFDVVSNPEFLKEGAAIEDFMKPDRVIIGADSASAGEVIRSLYLPFNRNNDRVIMMGVRSAEMTKYAANAMLATKISFMNELSRLCDALGVDIADVRQGIGSDSRIGYKFIYPGLGFGGSCFPKDLKALIRMHRENDLQPSILESVERVNSEQKAFFVEKIAQYFGHQLDGLVFAIWGLAFKPQTDDMREAPSIDVIRSLRSSGAKIRAYDPVAIDEARKIFGDDPGIVFCPDEYDALEGASAMLLLTEWHQFRYPDFAQIKNRLAQPVIFDGRNQYDLEQMKELGFKYISVGRPAVI